MLKYSVIRHQCSVSSIIVHMNSNSGRTLCGASSNLYYSEHKSTHHTLSDYGGLLALKALIKIQNANDKMSTPKTPIQKMLSPTPKPQHPNTKVSSISYSGVLPVAFRPDTLIKYRWKLKMKHAINQYFQTVMIRGA